MVIFSDEACLGYGEKGHPERPFRVEATSRLLRQRHPDWNWPQVKPATEESLLRAHPTSHLHRLQVESRFDEDTAYHEGIYDLTRLAAGAALSAMEEALDSGSGFALMRPPGHHAEAAKAMGFCYLNHIAICALEARARGIGRIAIWDFDAHHGNGTEAILQGVEEVRFASIHQHPCYPGTGLASVGNCYNFPVAPREAPERHMEVLAESWRTLMEFEPELVLVSAGFDAYEHDPLTQMSLRKNDFSELGRWLAKCGKPVAGLLEGGYSEDLPELVDAFLSAWSE